jgi:hypothetical protein
MRVFCFIRLRVASTPVWSRHIQFGLGLFPRDQRLRAVFGDGSLQIPAVFLSLINLN